MKKKNNKDAFKPMSIEELNKGIDKSEDDFKNGRYKTSAELLAKYKQMKLKIIWSDYAETQLDKIFEYYAENANDRVAKNLIQKIIAEPNRLLESPNSSQIEDLLLDRENLYRYLIYKNYKIIYSVDEKKHSIQIADVFDTRQNPEKIKRTK